MKLLLLLLLFEGESLSNDLQQVEIQIPKNVTVQEGLCVSIPCSLSFPQDQNNSKTYGYWFQGKDKDKLVATNDCQNEIHSEAQGRFHLLGNLQKDNCSLSMAGAQKWDTGEYWFQVEKGNLRKNFSHTTVSVNVIDLTEKPKILIPGILVPGVQVTLICIAPGDCRERISPNFLWTGSALSSEGFVSQDVNSSKLLFTPKAQDHGTNLTCQVTFPETNGTTETTVQLRIACILRILHSNCFWERKRLLCTCSIQGDLAFSLRWRIGNRIVDGNCSDGTLHVEYKTSGTWTNSTLILPKKPDANLSIRCEGRNHNETQSVSVQLLVPDTWNFLEWIIKGAFCGIIITAVLFTCLTVCLVRMLKKKMLKKVSESTTSGTRMKHDSTVNSVTELAECKDYENQGPSKHPSSPVLVSGPQKEEDQVQYASISFQTKKFQKTPKAEDKYTEYSELNFH